MKKFGLGQFVFFRTLLGIYLCFYFAHLIPYAGELFGPAGVISDPTLNPTHSYFPNLLEHLNSPLAGQIFLASLAIISLIFVSGYLQILTSLLLWYGFACLFNRNNLISDPALAYVGWALLACALVPQQKKGGQWQFPATLFYGAWIILAAGYLFAGVSKLNDPNWRNGSAVGLLLNYPLARSFPFPLPHVILRGVTWLIIGVQILFLPLALIPRLRFYAWLSAVILTLGGLVFLDQTDLSLGILVFHFFVWDPRWFCAPSVATPSIVFFDGICGLCNRSVDWLIEMDVHQVLKFAPLQGKTARQTLGAIKKGDPDSVIFFAGGKSYLRSRGILQALWAMGGIYRLLAAPLLLIPSGVFDPIYNGIARNRYRWFGKHDSCRLPTPEERSRFLD